MSGTEVKSYCIVCDQASPCGHNRPRYLDPVVYEIAATGWAVPEREMHRWNNPPKVTRTPPRSAPPLEALMVDVEKEISPSQQTAQQVEIAYRKDPLRTTDCISDVLRAINEGTCINPAGLLSSKFRRENLA